MLLWLLKLIFHQCIQAPHLWPEATAFVCCTPWSRVAILNSAKCLCACSQVPSHWVSRCPITSPTHVHAFISYQVKPEPKYPSLDPQYASSSPYSFLPTRGVSPLSYKALPAVIPHHFSPYHLIFKKQTDFLLETAVTQTQVHRLSVPSTSLTL